jgi:uncharacterized protein (TIGR03435 family)
MRKHETDTLSPWEALILIAAALALGAQVAIGTLTLRAQTPAAAPKFEVASVKINKSGETSVRIGMQPGGRFTATNVSLRALIRFAYQLQDFQIVGGPDWVASDRMASDRYDIVAKAENDVPPGPPGTVGPMQLMTRSLLEERFKLAVHQESRELPIYALVVARSDGKLGAKLSPSTVDCQAMMKEALGRGGPPAPPPQVNGRPVCGMRSGAGQMVGGGFPLSQLAASLSGMVQRVVIDRTGLKGNYDLELTYTPDQMPQGTPPPGAPAPAIDPGGPSIFTALQEQLGLKLESQRGPVDVLVIDRAERPTEN